KLWPPAMPAEIASNRRAFHNFQILEKIEAGISLTGTEVKSIRAGFATLSTAFARSENQEVFLYDADIQPYERASHEQHDPRRPRKLLLHKAEIAKLFEASDVKGLSRVSLRLYWKDKREKMEIRIRKGKTHAEKRQELRKKAAKDEVRRAADSFN